MSWFARIVRRVRRTRRVEENNRISSIEGQPTAQKNSDNATFEPLLGVSEDTRTKQSENSIQQPGFAAAMSSTADRFLVELGIIEWEPFVQKPDDGRDATYYFFAALRRIEWLDESELGGDCIICCNYTRRSKIIRPCKICADIHCRNCVREWALRACSNEAEMPPKCCGPINMGAIRRVLRPEELRLYMEKEEEARTANRAYCPVPTCSAFIPYRLFPPTARPLDNYPIYDEQIVLNESTPKVESTKEPPPDADQATEQPVPEQYEPPSIACPKCTVQVCCTCKQLKHPGSPCATDELDPEIEAVLTKLKIKRCPKCRMGVRRMFGCNTMGCRCGFTFCWECLRSTKMCRQEGCTDDDDEDDDEDDDDENIGGENEGNDTDDLDSEWEDDGDHDFGEEPGSIWNSWKCPHWWHSDLPARNQDLGYDMNCEACGKVICDREDTETETGGKGKKDLFHCSFCSIVVCRECHGKLNFQSR
ncbi:predicted protein [Uncinocarpus reesii 1704]|uniref:RING-type domain-containing protein n=1 Tax=Uncinocarpus reesii (strain UAMH 1704) TaxID=336963 RepID=C4JZF7_UNCRE|nr:uncharacterized protein UREG_07558 [Uncinocarpus reesii 1704]EEP82693.1 predicted protein [Uncinocarpus reesii 1704]